MDTRQLKTLIAIAEHGTFAKAAEAVGLTPSAVSQQIQALEMEVRAELFDRSSRPITLNGHGLQMLEAARTLVRDADNIIDAISGRAVGGTFTIGSVRSSALSLLPLSIVALKADYPDLRIKLQVANTDERCSVGPFGLRDGRRILRNSFSVEVAPLHQRTFVGHRP
jgi:DNA-binding transcriptional LysR family regulator